MWKEIQQFWESFSLHCLLTPVNSLVTWMLGQAWEQFFSKGPLRNAWHSTQELQNRQPQLTPAGAEALSPGFGCGWALPKHRQGLPAPVWEVGGSPAAPMLSPRMSLTCICHRARGSRGNPGRRGAGTRPGTGSGCSGRSRGGCTHCRGCSSSRPLTSCTGRRCPGTRVCTCTPRSRICHGLQGEDFSDQDPTESKVTVPLPVLGKHHPPCTLHAILRGMVEEVLQVGAVGARTPKPTHLGFGRERQHLPWDLIF